MLWILRREGANVQGLLTLFKAVDQGIIIFGSKMWVMTPAWAVMIFPGNKEYWADFFLNPPNLPGNVIFQPITPLLATQLQRTQRLHFTSRSPIDQTLALEEAFYLIFNTSFHFSCRPTNIIGT